MVGTMDNGNLQKWASLARELRLATHMSRQEFADALGIKDVTVWTWEAGRHAPLAQNFRKMMEKLRASGHVIPEAIVDKGFRLLDDKMHRVEPAAEPEAKPE